VDNDRRRYPEAQERRSQNLSLTEHSVVTWRIRSSSQAPERMPSLKESACAISRNEDPIQPLIYNRIIRATMPPQNYPNKNAHGPTATHRSQATCFVRRISGEESEGREYCPTFPLLGAASNSCIAYEYGLRRDLPR
jgi:hypothetical protein